jgi:phosphoribosylaminoimidazolecarboxamide formyltransferase / IMP cyclohydrolase
LKFHVEIGVTDPKIVRALISVSDKTGLLAFAEGLVKLGIELISTGGTAKALGDAGIPVRDVSNLTGFPEIMDGRVKTLHPKVHGGLLNVRGNSAHEKAKSENDISNIDLLVVNLYPFEATVAQNADWNETIENIDVGGPAMIRAAAKNHESVTVIVDPQDYGDVLAEISTSHATKLETRKRLAAKAFSRTAAYDTAIANWFNAQNGDATPDYFTIGGPRIQVLRYGENPHQTAALYKTSDKRSGIAQAIQLQGKELSYNNINDADAALEALREFEETACVIVKHANPCGVAIASTSYEAYAKALACDTTSAFGGIIAFNRKLDGRTAEEISKLFTEVIIAPDADEDAKRILSAKKNLRLLTLADLASNRISTPIVKSIAGGLLVQSSDAMTIAEMNLRVVTKRQTSPQELLDLQFAFRVAKHVKSNAIVFAKDGATTGIGAGQMSRIDSTRIAVRKGADALGVKGSVLASDAFFPFPDGLEAAAEEGATAIIQPGGAMKDQDVIAAADKAGLAMIFTGVRHFKH